MPDVMTMILLIAGLSGVVIMFVAGICMLAQAFKEGVLWGLGYMFVPFVGLVFILMNWEKCGRYFIASLVGLGLVLGAGALVPTKDGRHLWENTSFSASAPEVGRKKELHRVDFRIAGFKDLQELDQIADSIARRDDVTQSAFQLKRPWYASVVYDSKTTDFPSIVSRAKLKYNAEILEVEDKSIEKAPDRLLAGEGKPVLNKIGALPIIDQTNDSLSAGEPGLLFFADSKSKKPEAEKQADVILSVYEKCAKRRINFSVVDVQQPDNEEQRKLMKSYFKGSAPLVVLFDKNRKVVSTKSGSTTVDDLTSQLEKLSDQFVAVSGKNSAAPAGHKEVVSEPPSASDVLAALKTYDVAAVETRLVDMPGNWRHDMYVKAVGAVGGNVQRTGELYAMMGLSEMYAQGKSTDKSSSKMVYTGAFQQIKMGGSLNPAVYQQPEFLAAVKKVFTSCGISEKLAMDFVEKSAKDQPINMDDYIPASK